MDPAQVEASVKVTAELELLRCELEPRTDLKALTSTTPRLAYEVIFMHLHKET